VRPSVLELGENEDCYPTFRRFDCKAFLTDVSALTASINFGHPSFGPPGTRRRRARRGPTVRERRPFLGLCRRQPAVHGVLGRGGAPHTLTRLGVVQQVRRLAGSVPGYLTPVGDAADC
jgi:hypothetical protein